MWAHCMHLGRSDFLSTSLLHTHSSHSLPDLGHFLPLFEASLFMSIGNPMVYCNCLLWARATMSTMLFRHKFKSRQCLRFDRITSSVLCQMRTTISMQCATSNWQTWQTNTHTTTNTKKKKKKENDGRMVFCKCDDSIPGPDSPCQLIFWTVRASSLMPECVTDLCYTRVKYVVCKND